MSQIIPIKGDLAPHFPLSFLPFFISNKVYQSQLELSSQHNTTATSTYNQQQSQSPKSNTYNQTPNSNIIATSHNKPTKSQNVTHRLLLHRQPQPQLIQQQLIQRQTPQKSREKTLPPTKRLQPIRIRWADRNASLSGLRQRPRQRKGKNQIQGYHEKTHVLVRHTVRTQFQRKRGLGLIYSGRFDARLAPITT